MTQINADKIFGVRVKILYKKQAPLANHDAIPAFAGVVLVGEWDWGLESVLTCQPDGIFTLTPNIPKSLF